MPCERSLGLAIRFAAVPKIILQPGLLLATAPSCRTTSAADPAHPYDFPFPRRAKPIRPCFAPQVLFKLLLYRINPAKQFGKFAIIRRSLRESQSPRQEKAGHYAAYKNCRSGIVR